MITCEELQEFIEDNFQLHIRDIEKIFDIDLDDALEDLTQQINDRFRKDA